MLTYKIHIIRHGLTQANLEGRYIGKTDLPLCEEGRRALEQLKLEGEYPPVDKVFSSPLRRAIETAEILFPDRLVEPVDKLRELDFGDFEGKTAAELENDPDFRTWISRPGAAPPNGETAAMLETRAMEAVAAIFAQMMEQRLLSVGLVTHGGVISLLLAKFGLPQRDALRWAVPDGRGYTLLLSTQMWMRDNKFEVYGQIPYERTDEYGFFG